MPTLPPADENHPMAQPAYWMSQLYPGYIVDIYAPRQDEQDHNHHWGSVGARRRYRTLDEVFQNHPTVVDKFAWDRGGQDLDDDELSELFAHARPDEIDWRPEGAMPEDFFAASRYERRNCPPGGINHNDRPYRAGQFIPGTVLFQHTPAPVEYDDASDHAAFQQAIRDNPHDDTNWLVYADWLDERGLPVQAARARWWAGAKGAIRDGWNTDMEGATVSHSQLMDGVSDITMGNAGLNWVRDMAAPELARHVHDAHPIGHTQEGLAEHARHFAQLHAAGLVDEPTWAYEAFRAGRDLRFHAALASGNLRESMHWMGQASTGTAHSMLANTINTAPMTLGYNQWTAPWEMNRVLNTNRNKSYSGIAALGDYMRQNPPPDAQNFNHLRPAAPPAEQEPAETPQQPDQFDEQYAAASTADQQPVHYARPEQTIQQLFVKLQHVAAKLGEVAASRQQDQSEQPDDGQVEYAVAPHQGEMQGFLQTVSSYVPGEANDLVFADWLAEQNDPREHIVRRDLEHRGTAGAGSGNDFFAARDALHGGRPYVADQTEWHDLGDGHMLRVYPHGDPGPGRTYSISWDVPDNHADDPESLQMNGVYTGSFRHHEAAHIMRGLGVNSKLFPPAAPQPPQASQGDPTANARVEYGPADETPLYHKLDALRPHLAQAAQQVYDQWDASDPEFGDPELGFGGICQDISCAISGVLADHGIGTRELDAQTGEQHVWTFAHDGQHGYHVDIHPDHYETGGGYNWQKIPGVQFTPDHVSITHEPDAEDLIGDDLKQPRIPGTYSDDDDQYSPEDRARIDAPHDAAAEQRRRVAERQNADAAELNRRRDARPEPPRYAAVEYAEGDQSDVMPMLRSISPQAWRGNQNADMTPRLVAADLFDELGRGREAAMLRDQTRHLYVDFGGTVNDAHELARRVHHPVLRPEGYERPDNFTERYIDEAIATGVYQTPAEWDGADIRDRIHPDTLAAMIADAHHIRALHGPDGGWHRADGGDFYGSRNGDQYTGGWADTYRFSRADIPGMWDMHQAAYHDPYELWHDAGPVPGESYPVMRGTYDVDPTVPPIDQPPAQAEPPAPPPVDDGAQYPDEQNAAYGPRQPWWQQARKRNNPASPRPRSEIRQPDPATGRIPRYAAQDAPTEYVEHGEADFHAQIHQTPDERTAHLVYADWLQEQGRHTTADLVRRAASAHDPANDSHLTVGPREDVANSGRPHYHFLPNWDGASRLFLALPSQSAEHAGHMLTWFSPRLNPGESGQLRHSLRNEGFVSEGEAVEQDQAAAAAARHDDPDGPIDETGGDGVVVDDDYAAYATNPDDQLIEDTFPWGGPVKINDHPNVPGKPAKPAAPPGFVPWGQQAQQPAAQPQPAPPPSTPPTRPAFLPRGWPTPQPGPQQPLPADSWADYPEVGAEPPTPGPQPPANATTVGWHGQPPPQVADWTTGHDPSLPTYDPATGGFVQPPPPTPVGIAAAQAVKSGTLMKPQQPQNPLQDDPTSHIPWDRAQQPPTAPTDPYGGLYDPEPGQYDAAPTEYNEQDELAGFHQGFHQSTSFADHDSWIPDPNTNDHLVFADWLQERGRDTTADLIRRSAGGSDSTTRNPAQPTGTGDRPEEWSHRDWMTAAPGQFAVIRETAGLGRGNHIPAVSLVQRSVVRPDRMFWWVGHYASEQERDAAVRKMVREGVQHLAHHDTDRSYEFDPNPQPDEYARVDYGPAEEEQAFRQAIHADPHDYTNHGVFSDWLREQGRHDEADFQQAMGAWMSSPDRTTPRGRYHDPIAHEYPWFASAFLDKGFPDGSRWGNMPWFSHGDYQIRQDPRHPDLTQIDPHDPENEHVARWHGWTGAFSWRTYPGMERAMRESFLMNRQTRRQQEAQDAPPPQTDVPELDDGAQYPDEQNAAYAQTDYGTHEEQAGFHDAMHDNPQDTTAALVYADWLQERGLNAHADVIRRHVEQFGPPRPEPAREYGQLGHTPNWHTALTAQSDTDDHWNWVNAGFDPLRRPRTNVMLSLRHPVAQTPDRVMTFESGHLPYLEAQELSRQLAVEALAGHPHHWRTSPLIRDANVQNLHNDGRGTHTWPEGGWLEAQNAQQPESVPEYAAYDRDGDLGVEQFNLGGGDDWVIYGQQEEEQSFHDAINREPTESTHHGVYADWLDERDRPHDAEFERSLMDLKQRGIHHYAPRDTPNSPISHLGYIGLELAKAPDYVKWLLNNWNPSQNNPMAGNPMWTRFRGNGGLVWDTHQDMRESLRDAYDRHLNWRDHAAARDEANFADDDTWPVEPDEPADDGDDYAAYDCGTCPPDLAAAVRGVADALACVGGSNYSLGGDFDGGGDTAVLDDPGAIPDRPDRDYWRKRGFGPYSGDSGMVEYGPDEEYQSFQQAIDADPLDSANHLVFADWLQEQGHHDESDFRRALGEWIADPGTPDPVGHTKFYPWVMPHPSTGGSPMRGVNPEFVRTTAVHNNDAPARDPAMPIIAPYTKDLRWKTYRGMEQALRRAFMSSLQDREQAKSRF